MNFVITNMTGFRNKGCEALTKVIIGEMKKRYPESKFKVLTNDPAYDSLWMRENSEISFHNTPTIPRSKVVRLYKLAKRLKRPMKRRRNSSQKSIECLSEADGVISTGGDVFSSTYGGLQHHLYPISKSVAFGKTVFILGHSIAPFNTDKELRSFKRVMENVSLITLRETNSLRYVLSLGLKRPHIELTADPAFLFSAADTKVTGQICNRYNLRDDKSLIGIAVSQAIVGYSHVSQQDHFQAITQLTKYIVEEMRSHVVLIPHVRERYSENDDRLICDQVYRTLNLPERVTVMDSIHSAEEVKGIIGKTSLMVVERMHAGIAALSQSIPTLVVGYSIKGRGILEDIFGEGATEDYLVPVQKVTGKVLIKHVDKIWNNRISVTERLSETIPTIRQRAERNFSLVQNILEGKRP